MEVVSGLRTEVSPRACGLFGVRWQARGIRTAAVALSILSQVTPMTNAIAQRSFAGGEIAPSLYARTDREKYATGLRKCRNFIVQKHGGVVNRPGTPFVAETKDSSRVARLIRFHFNDDQTYALEFGHLYMRIHKNGAPLTIATPAAWVTATVYALAALVSRGGVNYYCTAAHTSGALTEPGVGANWATVWYALTGNIYEIPTPYTDVNLMHLQVVQSADVMTITSRSYAPRNLSRLGETSWTLALVAFGPTIQPPTNFTRASGGLISPEVTRWAITAVSAATGEESLIATTQANIVGDPANAAVLTWTASTGAAKYNLYRELGSTGYSGYSGTGTYGLFGSTTSSTTFSDTGPTAMPVNYEIAPPRVSQNADFNALDEYPAAVNYYQQRRLFAGSSLNPETVWGSRIDEFGNFATSIPMRVDDAIEFRLIGKQVNEIRHLLDLDPLFIFTSGGEFVVHGDEAGIILPTEINARQFSYHGIHEYLDPLVVGAVPIFVQARGGSIRKLVKDEGARGADLTLYAKHLIRGHSIVDWDYAEMPNSVVYAVRSDGKLIALTFIPEDEVWGWHWHDTDGEFENVVTVPEGDEDAVYVIVKRTINGSVKRYVERFASRHFTDIEDAVFMDSALTYDGWNTGAETVTITGGTDWIHTELLTVTRSVGGFVAGDVGNIVIVTLLDSDGVETARARIVISEYVSSTVVRGYPEETVPAGLRGVARTTWARAVDVVTGLSHLEGKAVSVFADGYVVASPNNEAYPAVTVAAGSAALPKPYAKIHVGLPYISDLETLDIDMSDRGTIKDRFILVNRVGLFVEDSRGIWVGQPDQPTAAAPLNGMQEYKSRSDENYGNPVALKTDNIEVNIESGWTGNGRVLVRQVDPLPLSILSVMPTGKLGE